MRSFLLVVLVSSLPLAGVFAQLFEPYRLLGDSSWDRFGAAVAFVGDANGDGCDDVIVGAPGAGIFTVNAGRVRVHSGLDGALLHAIDGQHDYEEFGYAVSGAGDIDADGHAEFIVGSPNAMVGGQHLGTVKIYSGLDGSLLMALQGDSEFSKFGTSVAGVGDVDGDGIDDFLVGQYLDSTLHLYGGSASLFSGLDGSLLFRWYGSSAEDRFGTSVAAAGDVNADGIPDVVVSAPADMFSPGFGHVYVYSGADGSQLHEFSGATVDGTFGESVAGAGDVNGDGVADILIGAMNAPVNGIQVGTAQVHSGSDGSLLHVVSGDSEWTSFGGSVAGVGDIDGDGLADFAVGAILADLGSTNSGAVRIYSGSDASLIATITGEAAGDFLGRSVAGRGDLNGDGWADMIVGAELDDGPGFNAGVARLFLGPDLPVVKYRTASALPHLLDLDWIPDAANVHALTGTLSCSGATPGGLGVAVASLRRVDVLHAGYLPFLVDPAPGVATAVEYFGFDSLGSLGAPGISRQIPALSGLRIAVQFFEVWPIISSSPGVSFAIAP